MGYRGDIAFGIVTQDTGGQDGGPVNGPLIAKLSQRARAQRLSGNLVS